MKKINAISILAAVALSACATLPSPEKPKTEMPVVTSNNGAVVALAQTARQDMSAGRLGAAAANIERALRIEPRNPTLWHELARVNLHQGRAAQAAQLARKSNTFAADNTALQAANWRLIGQARTQDGDQAGAEAAFARATQLDQQR